MVTWRQHLTVVSLLTFNYVTELEMMKTFLSASHPTQIINHHWDHLFRENQYHTSSLFLVFYNTLHFLFLLQPLVAKKYFPDGASSETQMARATLRMALQHVRVSIKTVDIYLFKVINRNTRTIYEIYSKLAIKLHEGFQ